MGDLFLAIEHDTEPTLNGLDNLKTMRLVEAAYQAAEEKRTVDVNEISIEMDAVETMQ
ncbi:MAG: hypothetical protein QGF67_07550 [Lentisphaeria bacterium]|jgi:predicted dehydrogenase|nr:hypothetical protein [Lentisphaeria bacterium]MDP7741278.1 hypothetical protein [Lentisphaeria bacterium]